MKTFQFVVMPDEGGTRLDQYLSARIAKEGAELSRRKLRSVIDAGGVYVNAKRVRIASREVVRGDRIKVEYSEEALKAIKRQDFKLAAKDILFDEDGVVAIDKPPGLASQATKDQSILHVIPVLNNFFKETAGKTRNLVLVHRLDKETSGILLLATNNERATFLTGQFRARHVKKVYWAVCYGLPKAPEFSEQAFLSEIDKKTGHVRVVRAGGRTAVTHFRQLAVNAKLGLSLLECRPETGRSHQIRVHLEHNGLPLVGDKRYGKSAPRSLPPELAELASVHHLLHARGITFLPAPNAAPQSLEAGLPDRFARFLAAAGLTQDLEIKR